MRRLLKLLPALALLCAAGCSRVPSGVIPPEEMAQLMADIHTGEAVIDVNRRDYNSDSVKQELRAAIYRRHGVTQEMIDSSQMWYGRHIDKYMDVYDRTIEILDHRLIESGNQVMAEAAMSVAGDSVDVWPFARYVTLGDKTPSRTIVFDFKRDENWERGDMYIWRAKLINNGHGSRYEIVSEYSDGTVDMVWQDLSGDGRKEMTLYTDSLLDATRIYGYLRGSNRPSTLMRVDSIELVRKRLDSNRYGNRFMTRRLEKFLKPQQLADSARVEKVDSTAQK